MRQTVSLRRRLANLFASAKVRPDEKKRRWANLFPRSFPLSTRRSSSIVSGLVSLFQELRGEKKGRRLATATVASAFASPKIEPLEQRQLLATWTVSPDPGAADCIRIQQAIDLAGPGDVIEVRTGDYSIEDVDTDFIDITVRLTGDASVGSLSGRMGTMDLGTFSLTTGATDFDSRFDGKIAGSGDLIKTGDGKFTLGARNDQFTGDIFIQQGQLSAIVGPVAAAGQTQPGSLGTADGATYVSLGAGLILGESGKVSIYDDIYVEGTGLGNGAIEASWGSVLYGDMILWSETGTTSGDTRLYVNGDRQSFLIKGKITNEKDEFGIPMNQGGIELWSGNSQNDLVLYGANDYLGATTVIKGVLNLGASNVIPDGSDLTIAGFAGFNLRSQNETIGSLAGEGSITLGNGTLTAGGSGADTAYAGSITGAKGRFVKEGAGTMSLPNVNLFGGAAYVNGGTLLIDGSLAPGWDAANNVVIVTNGHLAGSGSLGGRNVVLGAGGSVSTAGGLQIGGVEFDPAANFIVNIWGLFDYDQLVAGGGVDLSNAGLDIVLQGGYVPDAGDSFTIINLPGGGAVIPPFEDFDEGTSFVDDGVIFHISYVGGTGNDVVITVNTAPVLADTDPTLDGITEDDRDSAGNTVADIVDPSKITDVNLLDDKGIAVTGSTTVGVGWWEYRTTGGDWTKLELAPGEALLLDLDDELRYVPDGRVGGTPQITYRAWDGTDGNSGDVLSNIASGNASAFSAFEETAAIDVTELDNDPEITGTVADQNVNDNAMIAPFSGVTIEKAADTTELTVTVCLLDGTGALTDANGVLTGNFLKSPTEPGTYEYTGPKSEVQPFLQALIFEPAENIATVGEQTFTRLKITVQDTVGVLPVVDDVTTVNALSINDAPEISGTVAGQVISDNTTTTPFADVVIEDADFNDQLALTVSFPDANGVLISPDFTKTGVDVDGIATYAYTGAAQDKASVQAALRAATFDPQENLLEGRLAYFEFDPAAFFNYRDVSEGFSTDGGMFKLHEEWEAFAWRSWDTNTDWIDQDPDPNVEDWIEAQQNVVVDAWKLSLTADPVGDDDEGIAGFSLVIASSETSAATADVLDAWGQALTATFVDGASAPEGWQVSFYKGGAQEDYTWNVRWATDDPDKFIRPGEAAGTFTFSLTTDDPITYGGDTVFRFGDPNTTAGNPPEQFAAVVFDWFWAEGVIPGEQGGFEDYFPTGEGDPRQGTGFEATAAMETQRVFTTRFDLDLTDLAGAAVNDNFTTVTATPMNDAPVANDDVDDPIGGPLTTDEATAIDIAADTLLANDTDLDNTYGPVDVLQIEIIQSLPGTKGTVSFDSNTGIISYDPAGAFGDLAEGMTATDLFTYTITDGNGATDTATVTITVTGINDDPVADDDSVATTEDDAIDISVMDNDSDPDTGDVLTLVGAGTSFTTDGGALVTINNDGTITYDPLGDPAANPAAPGPFDDMQAGDTTQDTFTYTVTDGHGATDTATVTIQIQGVNDQPYSGPDTGSTDEQTAYHAGPIGDAPGWEVVAGYNPLTGELMVSVNSEVPQYILDSLPPGQDPPIAGILEWTIRSTDGSAVFEDAGGNPYPAPILPGNPGNDVVVTSSEIKEAISDAVILNLLANGFGPNNANVPVWLDYTSHGLGVGVIDTGLTLRDDPADPANQLELSYTVAMLFPHPDLGVQIATFPAIVPLSYMNTGLLPNDADVDGSAVAGPIAVIPESKTSFADAAMTINADGSYDYDPSVSDRLNALAEGEQFNDTFTYKVQDADGAANGVWNEVTVTITVTGVNDDPQANDDSGYVTDEDTAVLIPVIANDTDADYEDDLDDARKPNDVDEVLSVKSVSDPPNGSVQISADKLSVTYTPDPNYHGTDSFTYVMEDITGTTSEATVTLTVDPVNDKPVANADSYGINEDIVTVLNIISDNDQDDADAGDAQNVLVIHEIDPAPLHGTLEISPDGTSVTYTPDENYFGTDTFTYTIRDRLDPGDPDGLISDPATVNIGINSVNDPPVLHNKYFFYVDDPRFGEGVEDSGGMVLNVFAGGNAPASWNPNPNSGNPLDQPVGFNPLHGLPLYPPQVIPADTDVENDLFQLAGAMFTEQTRSGTSLSPSWGGEITYSPGKDFFGLDTFKYYVSDTFGGPWTAWAWVTVYVAPLPDPPDAVNDTATVNEETPTVIDVLANDVEPDLVYLVPPPAVLNQGIVITGATNGTRGTVEIGTLDGSGVFVPSLPGETGMVVRYTPEVDYNGPDSFTYTVDNGKGLGTDTATVNLNVQAVNDLVQIVNLPAGSPEGGDKSPMKPFENFYQDDNENSVFYAVDVVDLENHRVNARVIITEPDNGTFLAVPGGFAQELDANFDPIPGQYVMYDKLPIQIGTALRNMQFKPTPNQVKPGATKTTVLRIEIEEIKRPDVLYLPDAPPTNPPIRTAELEVDIYSINDPPKIIVGNGLVVTDDVIADPVNNPLKPFEAVNGGAGVQLTEPDVGDVPGQSQPLDVRMTYASNLQGTLVDPDEATDPLWQKSDDGTTVTLTYVGTDNYADAIEAALARLVFTPIANIVPVGNSTLSAFTIQADDGYVDPNFPVKVVVTVQSVSINDVPVANDDPDATTDEDTVLVADASRNLLENDDDDDPGEVLQVLSNTEPVSGAALTVFADGTYVYDPTVALNYLALGDPTYVDTFTYTVTDGHGGQSTAEVTIEVTGLNDAPTAVDDDLTANPLLQNATREITFEELITRADGTSQTTDWDPDTNDNPLLTINGVSALSEKGAAVTIVGDTIHYDPTDAADLKALAEGVQDTDTFTYTLVDPNGATAEATVTLTITGVNDAPGIDGTVSGQATTDKDTIDPFAGVTITDADGGTLTLTVTYPAANGDLTGAGAGIYTTSGTAAEVTAAIRGLTFDPTENRKLPGQSETTTFEINVEDDLGVDTTNSQTTVNSLSINDPPTIDVDGFFPIDTNDKTPVSGIELFGGVSIDDVDNVDAEFAPGVEQQLTVEVSFPDANGTLSHPTIMLQKSVVGDVATYSFPSTASAAETDLQGIVLTPAENRKPVAGDNVETTTLTITVIDVPTGAEATDSKTMVASTSVNDPPTANPITYVIGENSVLSSSTNDPGLDPAPVGTAIGGYNALTGELIVSANGVESWTIASLNPLVTLLPSPNDVLDTLPTPNGIGQPVTHDAQTVGEDAGQGGDLTYSGLSLGAIAMPLLNIDDLYIEYRVGGGLSAQMPLVVLEGAPSGGSGVLRNDRDPDPGDTPLTVLAADTQSPLAALDGVAGNVTVAADGTLTYDPTGLPSLNELAVGEMLTDTFSYTITDGNGEQRTTTVTVFIRGENDAPLAVDDDANTPGVPLSQDTVLPPIDHATLLANDYDPDESDELTIIAVSDSAGGATVIIDPIAKTITYDPRYAADLKGIPQDVEEPDTFTYTITDGHPMVAGQEDRYTADVTVYLVGVNDAPTISGMGVDLGYADNVAIYPFSGVSIDDADRNAEVMVTITLDNPDNGVLVGLGFTETGTPGVYSTGLLGISPQEAHDSVRALQFVPTQFKEEPAGGTSSSTFTFEVVDQLGASVVVVDDQGDPVQIDPEITVTTQWVDEPRVAAVYVRGTEWQGEYLDLVGPFGYEIPSDFDQLRDLPWFNLNQITVRFSENVIVDEDALTLVGVNVAQYDLLPGGFSYDAGNFAATWTFAKNIGEGDKTNNNLNAPATYRDDSLPDKLLLALDAGSIYRAGSAGDPAAALDGDWTNPDPDAEPLPVPGSAFTSGDGTAGGDFQFRMDVVPGNTVVNDTSPGVDGADVTAVANAQFSDKDSGYDPFLNVNGSEGFGFFMWHVDATDTVLVRNAQLTGLPPGEPVPAPLPALSPASAALSDGLGGLMTNFGRTLHGQFSQLDVGLVSDLGIGGADWRAALRRSTVRAVDLALDELAGTSNVAQAASDLVRDCWSRYGQHRNDKEGTLDDLFGMDDSVFDDGPFGGDESPFGEFFRSMAAGSNQRANGFMRRMTL
ncbi:MAG TPA: Ig-like domain-containing protein [Thermoguttaceae bacterium]|nr:Ig-like domain-containing protein [Thermoguttaceae bacterium]